MRAKRRVASLSHLLADAASALRARGCFFELERLPPPRVMPLPPVAPRPLARRARRFLVPEDGQPLTAPRPQTSQPLFPHVCLSEKQPRTSHLCCVVPALCLPRWHPSPDAPQQPPPHTFASPLELPKLPCARPTRAICSPCSPLPRTRAGLHTFWRGPRDAALPQARATPAHAVALFESPTRVVATPNGTMVPFDAASESPARFVCE
jgi:hypothetical protein